MAELEALSTAAAEGAGRTVLVEAPAGAGKSTLLACAAERAEREGVRVLRASGGEYERDYAFGAVRQLFEPVARPELLGGSAAAAAAVLDPVGAPVTPGFGVFHALYWLVANLAQEEPLLLVVDDLHWVDDASLQALDYIARRLGDLPVSLLGTLRPSEPEAHVEQLDALRAQAAVLALGALSADAVAELVAEDRADADAVAAAYHEASAGNPLYVRELLRALPEADAEAIRAAAIPGLGERVVRRIRRVAPEAVPLAAAVALLGDGHPLELAIDLAELDPPVAAEIARELVRIDILRTDDPPAFAHPVIRQSVYADLSTARRASMHAYAAEVLEARDASPDAVAAHLAALPRAGSAAVAERLYRAGADALARGAAGTAIRRLRRALAEGAGAPERAQMLLTLGRAQSAAGDPDCVATLKEAFAAASDDLKPEIAVVLTGVLAGAGAWAEVDRVTADAQAVAEDGSPAHGYLLAASAVLDADFPERSATFRAGRDRYARFAAGDSWAARAVAAMLARTGVMYGHPREEVLALARHAVEGDALLAEHHGGSWAPVQVLIALIQLDAFAEAEPFMAALGAYGRRTGMTLHAFGALGLDSWARARRGDLASAAGTLDTLLETATAAGMPMWVVSVAYMVQDIVAERPSLDHLADRFDAIELPPRFASSYAGVLLFEARARIAAARGDRARAVANLRSAERTFRSLGMGPGASPWRSRLALALAPEEPEAAAALAAEELELAEAAGYPRAIGIARRAAGTLAGDEALLRASLAALADTPAALERVYTQLELGVLLRRSQRLPEARTVLTAALDGAARAGADRTLQRARDELAAAGARPRRSARTGREALTPRELRIAELAAAGRTNAEIAQELFVTLKTVETHLTNAYGKLGLSGHGARERLSHLLEDQPEVVE